MTATPGLLPMLSVDGALLAVGDLLVQGGIIAAVVLASIWLSMVLWRERMLREVTREFPENAKELRAAARRAPLLRSPRAPADPFARTHQVVVEALGDGRPGESFWAPGPSLADGRVGPDGSRTDARVLLGPGTHLLVVCLGRVGAPQGGTPIEPAEQRVHVARAQYGGPRAALGPVDRVETALGTGWRTTCVWEQSGKALTDTHVDHDGWAFIVGVLSSSWHARAVAACDAVLTTWRWLPATGETVAPGGPAA